jgi:hypothetical protein
LAITCFGGYKQFGEPAILETRAQRYTSVAGDIPALGDLANLKTFRVNKER